MESRGAHRTQGRSHATRVTQPSAPSPADSVINGVFAGGIRRPLLASGLRMDPAKTRQDAPRAAVSPACNGHCPSQRPRLCRVQDAGRGDNKKTGLCRPVRPGERSALTEPLYISHKSEAPQTAPSSADRTYSTAACLYVGHGPREPTTRCAIPARAIQPCPHPHQNLPCSHTDDASNRCASPRAAEMVSRQRIRLARMTRSWGTCRSAAKVKRARLKKKTSVFTSRPVRKSRGWRPAAYTWKDTSDFWRLPAKDLHGRIKRLKRRGLPCRLSWHEEPGFMSIQMDPLPGWTNLCTKQSTKAAFGTGKSFHSTLALRKHLPGGAMHRSQTTSTPMFSMRWPASALCWCPGR